jgi:hypothetical protein
MPTVKIPPVLRAQTGGEAELETPGSTVGVVILPAMAGGTL